MMAEADLSGLQYIGDWGSLAIWPIGAAPDFTSDVVAARPWQAVGHGESLRMEDAQTGRRPVVQEQRQYVVRVRADGLRSLTWGWQGAQLPVLSWGDEVLCQLDTGNAVGRSQLTVELHSGRSIAIPVRVATRKLAADEDYDWLVNELARSVRAIALNMSGPTRLPTARTSRARSLGYEDLVFLTSVIRDVERTVERIASRPHRKLIYEPDWRDLGSIAELDPGSLSQLAGAGHALQRVSEAAHTRVLPLAARSRLRTMRGDAVLPSRLPVRSRRISHDTFENRFVRHVLEQFGARARAVAQEMAVANETTHAAAAREIEGRCRAMLRQPFLAEAGELTSMQATSQVLMRDDSYNRMLRTYQEFLLSADVVWESLRQSQENRDVAELYEMWVYLETVRALRAILGGKLTPPADEEPVVMATNEGLIVSLRRDKASGLRLGASQGVSATAYYNRSFSSRRGLTTAVAQSYSLPLRPDVVVEIQEATGARRFVLLDAKYRIDRVGTAFADLDEAEDAQTSTAFSTTFKAADVHKMHAYRDAIDDVVAALAVYPGTDVHPTLYPRVGFAGGGGVGAVPLRPGGGVRRNALRNALRVAFRAGSGAEVSLPNS